MLLLQTAERLISIAPELLRLNNPSKTTREDDLFFIR